MLENRENRPVPKSEERQASDTIPGSGAQPSDILNALTARVLTRWRGRLRRLPDGRARSGDRGESERNLVRILLRATESRVSSDDESLPALAAAAARYGAGQRRERIDPGALCDELSALRGAAWEVMKEVDPKPHHGALERILAFDRALSIVLRAAVMAGYDPEQARDSIRCHALESEAGSNAIGADAADKES